MELQMQPLSTRPARNPLFCASMAQARPVGPAPITRRSKAGSVAVGMLFSLMAVGMGAASIADRFVPPNSPDVSSFFCTLLPLEDSCCKLACKRQRRKRLIRYIHPNILAHRYRIEPLRIERNRENLLPPRRWKASAKVSLEFLHQ